jgi:hypothetical protein
LPWLVEKASWIELINWIADKIPDADTINEQLWYSVITWTTYTAWQALTERTSISIARTKKKEIQVLVAWTYTFSATVKETTAYANPIEDYLARFYVNWVAVTWKITWNAPTVYTVKTRTYTANAWDLLQIYLRTRFDGASYTTYVKDYTVKYDMSWNRTNKVSDNTTVNLD